MEKDETAGETGDEATNVGEVVDEGEKTDDEGNHNVEDQECKVLDGTLTLPPGVAHVEEREGEDSKDGARCSAVIPVSFASEMREG